MALFLRFLLTGHDEIVERRRHAAHTCVALAEPVHIVGIDKRVERDLFDFVPLAHQFEALENIHGELRLVGHFVNAPYHQLREGPLSLCENCRDILWIHEDDIDRDGLEHAQPVT